MKTGLEAMIIPYMVSDHGDGRIWGWKRTDWVVQQIIPYMGQIAGMEEFGAGRIRGWKI